MTTAHTIHNHQDQGALRRGAPSFDFLPRSRYLTEVELRRLLAAVERYGFRRTRPKHRMLFLLLVNFGPRISEALALRVRDVDLTMGAVTFPTLKRRRPVIRTLPLPPVLYLELEAYIRGQRLGTDDLLFPHLRKGYAWVVLKRCLRRAGLSTHYSLKELRHSAGTRIADKTRDSVLVRDVLGHASISTSNIYLHTVHLREKLLSVPALTVGWEEEQRG